MLFTVSQGLHWEVKYWFSGPVLEAILCKKLVRFWRYVCHALCTCVHTKCQLLIGLSDVCNVLDRPHHQSAAQRHEVCGEEDYLVVQQHFHAMVVAYATDSSEPPIEDDVEAAHGAQQWLGVVDEAASRADACGLPKLKAQIILLTYYGLFDEHRHSAALADVCPR